MHSNLTRFSRSQGFTLSSSLVGLGLFAALFAFGGPAVARMIRTRVHGAVDSTHEIQSALSGGWAELWSAARSSFPPPPPAGPVAFAEDDGPAAAFPGTAAPAAWVEVVEPPRGFTPLSGWRACVPERPGRIPHHFLERRFRLPDRWLGSFRPRRR
jgi:hypothetical protein